MRNYIMQAMIILVVGFSSAILLPSIASAHDIWLTEGPGHVIQIDFGDLSARQLADVRKLVTLTLIGADGKVDLRATLPTPSEAHGHPVLVSQPIKAPPGSVVEVSYDNGFWITAPGDKLETNASSLMIPNGTGKHWTVKYAKLLLGFGSYTKVLGKRAELVAMRDPFTNADATLPVKLLLDGKPYAGAKIAYTDGLEPLPDENQPTVETGPDGVALIPFHKGLELLTTDLNTKAMHPSLANTDHLYVAMTFETPK